MTLSRVWAMSHRDNNCGMPILGAGFKSVEKENVAAGDQPSIAVEVREGRSLSQVKMPGIYCIKQTCKDYLCVDL